MRRQTDMTKLIVAFRNFANAPKNVITTPFLEDLRTAAKLRLDVSEEFSAKQHRYILIRRVRKITKSNNQLRYVCPSVHLSAWNNSVPNRRILMKI